MNDSTPLLPNRRRWLKSGVLLAGTPHLALPLLGCAPADVAAGPSPGADPKVFDTRVTVEPGAVQRSANRQLLGANVQWVDRGDEMLEPGTLRPRPGMAAAMQALGPTVLRYPGGTLSDVYHWRDGMGELPERKEGEHFWSRQRQKIEMGTREFLELCRTLGAEPLITVNLITGTPEEAAQWVTAVNKTRIRSKVDGGLLPRVRYWELGNEPYLKDDARPELSIAPAEFVRRASLFARAMRAADPTILIGLPTRSDFIGGAQLTPYKGFGDLVLGTFSGDFDYVALHNAYMPFGVDRDYTDDQLYWAAMASAEVVAADFAATRAQLARLRPGRAIKLAVTEYGAIFTLTMDRKRTDAYIRSLAGAIYLADVLRMFANQPDLMLAVLHSLSGNWHFGLVSNEGQIRPAYFVLQAVGNLLRGNVVRSRVTTESFDVGRVGVVPETKGLPLVTSLATVDNKKVRLMLINKDLVRTSRTIIGFTSARPVGEIGTFVIDGERVFDPTDSETKIRRRKGTLAAGAGDVTLNLPPHSITFLEFQLR
jgi:alpha-N-arabinofuranosidase